MNIINDKQEGNEKEKKISLKAFVDKMEVDQLNKYIEFVGLKGKKDSMTFWLSAEV